MRRPWSLPSSSALQIHEPKMKVDPFEKIMLSRSIKLSDAKSPKAPTWRASCRCLTTDSLPRGYPGSIFGLRHMLDLMVNARDSRFILVQALDRRSSTTLRPVGVSLCIGLIMKYCVVQLLCSTLDPRCPALLYIVRRLES